MADSGKAENSERRVSMKKNKAAALIAGMIVLLLVFFPYTISNVISGDAEILNLENETIGACTLSIEIHETRSLLIQYKKQFSYTLDGERHDSFVTSSHSETDDGVCLISQMYYDEKKDAITLCSLFYLDDLSEVTLRVDEQQYMISPQ